MEPNQEGGKIAEIPVNALIAVTSNGNVYVIPEQHLADFRQKELETDQARAQLQKIDRAGVAMAAYRKGAVIFGDA